MKPFSLSVSDIDCALPLGAAAFELSVMTGQAAGKRFRNRIRLQQAVIAVSVESVGFRGGGRVEGFQGVVSLSSLSVRSRRLRRAAPQRTEVSAFAATFPKKFSRPVTPRESIQCDPVVGTSCQRLEYMDDEGK